MHVHVIYISNMRTTIELPAALRQKIVTEAARQNLKGFSPIIVKALKESSEILQQHASEISDTLELKSNLSYLAKILNVLSKQDFNAFLNLSLDKIQIEVDSVFKELKLARFDFENHLQKPN